MKIQQILTSKQRRESIKEWEPISAVNIKASETIRNNANGLQKLYRLQPKDSLHLVCAIEAKSDYFLTTDKILMKKATCLKEIKVVNPLEFISLLEEK